MANLSSLIILSVISCQYVLIIYYMKPLILVINAFLMWLIYNSGVQVLSSFYTNKWPHGCVMMKL